MYMRCVERERERERKRERERERETERGSDDTEDAHCSGYNGGKVSELSVAGKTCFITFTLSYGYLILTCTHCCIQLMKVHGLKRSEYQKFTRYAKLTFPPEKVTFFFYFSGLVPCPLVVATTAETVSIVALARVTPVCLERVRWVGSLGWGGGGRGEHCSRGYILHRNIL